MNEGKRNSFVSRWRKYFGDAELPLVAFYSDSRPADAKDDDGADRCIIGALSSARKGETLCFDASSEICSGAKRYLGFTHEVAMPDFEHFLSYGIPGKARDGHVRHLRKTVRRR